MRRTDLDAEQRAVRELVVQRLGDAGWDPEGWEELFAADAKLEPEAQLEYTAGPARLSAGFSVGENAFTLERRDPQDGGVLHVRFRARDVSGCLGVLVKFQDELSPDTLPDFVAALSPVAEDVQLATPDGFVRVEL